MAERVVDNDKFQTTSSPTKVQTSADKLKHKITNLESKAKEDKSEQTHDRIESKVVESGEKEVIVIFEFNL